MPYQQIVFIQGEESDEPLRILYDKHDDSVVWSFPGKVHEAIEYLAQWDYGDAGEETEEPSCGSGDNVRTEGNYRMSWNLGLSYIGLERMVPAEEWIDGFVAGYAHCMLWANTRDESGESVDPAGWMDGSDTYWQVHAFDSESQSSIWRDCRSFAYGCWYLLDGLDAVQCGHDFALTRNGHGTGFWDRGLGERGGKLTEAAKVHGESTATANGSTVRLDAL